jgi:hypothetical protein
MHLYRDDIEMAAAKLMGQADPNRSVGEFAEK